MATSVAAVALVFVVAAVVGLAARFAGQRAAEGFSSRSRPDTSG